ncbi:MAG TPA: hypothetical protein VGH83_01570 [Candidatus Acidoferrum sp.]|jgi:hypothetical protein
MIEALRYYWMAARGYRLRPWESPYIRWRFETFLGPEAAGLDAAKFFALSWKYRARMEDFIQWVGERRNAQRTSAAE